MNRGDVYTPHLARATASVCWPPRAPGRPVNAAIPTTGRTQRLLFWKKNFSGIIKSVVRVQIVSVALDLGELKQMKMKPFQYVEKHLCYSAPPPPPPHNHLPALIPAQPLVICCAGVVCRLPEQAVVCVEMSLSRRKALSPSPWGAAHQQSYLYCEVSTEPGIRADMN